MILLLILIVNCKLYLPVYLIRGGKMEGNDRVLGNKSKYNHFWPLLQSSANYLSTMMSIMIQNAA